MKFLNHFALASSFFFLVILPCPLFARKTFAYDYAHYITHGTKSEPTIVWTEKKCPKFHELILSWNARKPACGSYTFFISCLIRGEWTSWKRYASWGKEDHLTYSKNVSPRLHTLHVRAMVPNPYVATGFRVRVQANDGADIKNVAALFCSTSHEGKFIPESGPLNFDTVRINGIEPQSQMQLNHQRKTDLCSPTALSVLINYLAKHFAKSPTRKPSDTAKFADQIHDQALNIYGSWPLNVAQAYEELGGKFYFRIARLNSFRDIYDHLKQNIPVVVSIRGPIAGGALPYLNGHFILIAGWNKQHQRVLCIDPAFRTAKRAKTSYAIDEFLRAWERSRRLSYVAQRG